MRFFGDPADWPDQDFLGFSDSLDVELVLAGYAEGVFPMPLAQLGFDDEMGWWSPVDRGILPPSGLRVTRSLRKSARHYRTTVDHAFDDVVAACGDPSRPDGWIDDRIREVYGDLHRQGVAHSVEVWTPDGRLAGGLYGIGMGGLFAGESMFHAEFGRDASKVALVHLCHVLGTTETRLLDVQWVTEHLASLGAIEVPRGEYLALLAEALRAPAPDWSHWKES